MSLSSHQSSASTTCDWLTPPEWLDALGGRRKVEAERDALAAELARMTRQWEGAVASYDTASALATRYSEALQTIAKWADDGRHDEDFADIASKARAILETGRRMSANCTWVRQNDSERGWFYAKDHPDEDMESRSCMRIWSFCPYCGKPLDCPQADRASKP